MLPYLGYGVGLRAPYIQTVLESSPSIDWFEIMTEDYLVPGGGPLYYLDRVRENYPLAMHGVSMSIGGIDPLNFEYLNKVKQLAERISPAWVSDHLCWTGVNGTNLHDLLPLPYTEEAIIHIVDRIKKVQDFLGRQILLENVSSYVAYNESQVTEWEFLTAIAEQADCLLLLDINNIYVSSFNHGYDPQKYLAGVPAKRVQQFHLAGHEHHTKYIVDTHDEPIVEAVWSLYKDAICRFGQISTLIERDDNLPPLTELLLELDKARMFGEGRNK